MNTLDRADDTMTDLDDLRVDLAIWRRERKVSRRWVADQVHSSRSRIYDFELGIGTHDPATVAAIAALVRRP